MKRLSLLIQNLKRQSIFAPSLALVNFCKETERYILHLEGIKPDNLAKLPLTRGRVAAVKKMRLGEQQISYPGHLLTFLPNMRFQPFPPLSFLVIPRNKL